MQETSNEIIKDAIKKVNQNKNNETVNILLNAILKKITEKGQFVIPVELPQKTKEAMEDKNRIQNGQELDFVLRKIKTEEGYEAIAVFTDADEASKGEKSATITYPIELLLRDVIKTEFAQGIIINPWTVPVYLPKEILQVVLDSLKPKSKICFNIGDITQIDCECIVNAANESLLGGGGVDGAIHKAAGEGLLEECRKLNGCKTGQCKITKGYNLKAKYVIHTVGPKYTGSDEDRVLLSDCYYNSLNLAKCYNIHSIAFPAISTGAYGYPVKEAVKIAYHTIASWLNNNPDYKIVVILSCFNNDVFEEYKSYIQSVNPNTVGQ